MWMLGNKTLYKPLAGLPAPPSPGAERGQWGSPGKVPSDKKPGQAPW